MARKRKPAHDEQTSKKKPSAKTSAPLKRHRPQEVAEPQDGLFDETTKRDIAGISFIVAAIVFMLLVAIPADGAIVSAVASEWIHLLFGVGAYILPFVLAGIGATFLYRSERERVPARAAIGLSVIFISLLALIATFTPTTSLGAEDLQLLFLDTNLVSHGGYIGAGLAFACMSLFGRLISGVIFVGLMIIGLVIVGFSVSKTIERARIRKRQRDQRRHEDPTSSFGSKRLRVRKAEDVAMQPGQPANFDEALLAQMPERADVTRPLMAAPAAHPETALQSAPTPAEQRIEYARAVLPDPHAVPSDRPSDPLGDQLTRPLGADELPQPVQADPQEVFLPLVNLTPEAEDPESLPFDEEPAEEDFIRLSQWGGGRGKGEEETAPDDGALKPVSFSSDIAALAESLPRIDDAVPLPAEAIKPQRKPRPKQEEPRRADTVKLEEVSAQPVQEGGFTLPPLSLLKQPGRSSKRSGSASALKQTASVLQQTLESFGINAAVVGWIAGPTVTLFQVDLPSGVRVSRIINLNDDIALALASPGVRIFAPIPGTNHVGIEIPNADRQTVLLSEVLKDAKGGALEIAIGKDVEGRSIISDLAKMPHLLIGGTTGSGKSVSINAMIMSILMRATPDEVRFIMIDPKRVEFTPYNGIPHLYVPVVTEPKEAASALAWGVAEMERRLKVFSKIGVRNITQFNAKVKDGGTMDDQGRELEPLPYIVIIIDELADLMMNVGKEVELSISRIAQLARAAGIHLIVATQRPSTNVVTGLIKANITNRIAFNVASGIDSRVILDTPGAENLIGLGDMLLSKPELPKPQRIQACYVSEEEIASIVDFVKAQGEPEYHSDILQTNLMSLGDTSPQGRGGEANDPLVWEAAEIVVSSKMGSTSNIQRRLKVGYARAGRIMDQLEELGVVGPANGSKPREVLVDELELETLKAFEGTDG